MINTNNIFEDHELRTVEIDVQNKIFKINGEELGRECSGFSIRCQADGGNDFFLIQMDVERVMHFLSFDKNGKGTGSRVLKD